MTLKKLYSVLLKSSVLVFGVLCACTSPDITSSNDDATVSVDDGVDASEDTKTEEDFSSIPDATTHISDTSLAIVLDAASQPSGESDPDASIMNATHKPDAVVGVDASKPDTGSELPLETPENLKWAEQLFGRYAGRTDSISVGMGSIINNTETYMAEFFIDDGRVKVRLEVCNAVTEWEEVGMELNYRILRPSSLPIRELEVDYVDGFWETKPASFNVGFETEPLVDCSPGERVSAHASQVWLSDGTCRCYSDELPQRIDDCRVIDLDDDGHPGFTMEVQGTVQNLYYGVTIRRDRYVKGIIDPLGHHQAFEDQEAPFAVLACLDPIWACDTGEAEATLCRAEANPVHFVPLPPSTPEGGDWNCAAINRHADTLFTYPTPNLTLDDC